IVLALEIGDVAQAGLGMGGSPPIAQRLSEGARLRRQGLGSPILAAIVRKERPAVQEEGADRRWDGLDREGLLEEVMGLSDQAVQLPVPPQYGDQAGKHFGLGLLLAPGQRRAAVLVLGLQPGAPLGSKPGPRLSKTGLGELQAPGAMRVPRPG